MPTKAHGKDILFQQAAETGGGLLGIVTVVEGVHFNFAAEDSALIVDYMEVGERANLCLHAQKGGGARESRARSELDRGAGDAGRRDLCRRRNDEQQCEQGAGAQRSDVKIGHRTPSQDDSVSAARCKTFAQDDNSTIEQRMRRSSRIVSTCVSFIN